MKINDGGISEVSQRELAAGLLVQAAKDLRRFHGATTAVERELYQDAYTWVLSGDCTWPYSFLNVCRLLNYGPDDLREELLGDLSLGGFSQWVRRRSRAFLRLSDSFAPRFKESGERTAAPTTLTQTSY